MSEMFTSKQAAVDSARMFAEYNEATRRKQNSVELLGQTAASISKFVTPNGQIVDETKDGFTRDGLDMVMGGARVMKNYADHIAEQQGEQAKIITDAENQVNLYSGAYWEAAMADAPGNESDEKVVSENEDGSRTVQDEQGNIFVIEAEGRRWVTWDASTGVLYLEPDSEGLYVGVEDMDPETAFDFFGGGQDKAPQEKPQPAVDTRAERIKKANEDNPDNLDVRLDGNGVDMWGYSLEDHEQGRFRSHGLVYDGWDDPGYYPE